jgi:hypothetical protein
MPNRPGPVYLEAPTCPIATRFSIVRDLVSSPTPREPHSGYHKPCNRKTDHADQRSRCRECAPLRKNRLAKCGDRNEASETEEPKQLCTHNYYLHLKFVLTIVVPAGVCQGLGPEQVLEHSCASQCLPNSPH